MPSMKRTVTRYTRTPTRNRIQIPEVSIQQEITLEANHTAVRVKTSQRLATANQNLRSISLLTSKSHSPA